MCQILTLRADVLTSLFFMTISGAVLVLVLSCALSLSGAVSFVIAIALAGCPGLPFGPRSHGSHIWTHGHILVWLASIAFFNGSMFHGHVVASIVLARFASVFSLHLDVSESLFTYVLGTLFKLGFVTLWTHSSPL